ncbi:MAG: glycine--tRNA ligase subunit beta [Sphingomonadales bacterium]
MAELLIELLSEEIPARMQAQAAQRLLADVIGRLKDKGISCDARACACHHTPRRLAVVLPSLPARQPDVSEERRGPSITAPAKAIEGFLASVGLTRDQVEERQTKKGTYLFATIEKKGRPTAEIIAELLPRIVREFPWPKAMRWGASRLSWVRPLHSVLCIFDSAPVVADIGDGLISGNETRGHRFLGPEIFTVSNFADYADQLMQAKVMLDPVQRRTTIEAQGHALESDTLKISFDRDLMKEVSGLVEWPVVGMGVIDEMFMDLPPEVLASAMQKHQKYFPVTDISTGEMAPRFAVVANLETEDSGQAIIAGNERVLRARLADARFFWDQDRKHSLESRVAALAGVVFHARLGSVGDKVERTRALAGEIAAFIPDANAEQAERAALLAKADLTTDMVGEFPDLQGVMGRYYALEQGEAPEVAEAIAEHYAPLGPADACPTAPISMAAALADKIDTLVGFFAIGEKPTGSKDPFGLRRAALGVIRIVLENSLRIPLNKIFDAACRLHGFAEVEGLSDFLADRLKVHLREQGIGHDLISAVFALSHEDDLVRLLDRVKALAAFLGSDDGANLLVAYRRAANIVRIEEKKDGTRFDGAVSRDLLREEDEKILFERLDTAVTQAAEAVDQEKFGQAMGAIADLRQPVDRFFDHVTVNSEDGSLRANRLRLLARIRGTLHTVADFSLIEG